MTESGVKPKSVEIAIVVAPAGFEPATLSLEVSCSIQLSYGATLGTRDPIDILTQSVCYNDKAKH